MSGNLEEFNNYWGYNFNNNNVGSAVKDSKLLRIK